MVRKIEIFRTYLENLCDEMLNVAIVSNTKSKWQISEFSFLLSSLWWMKKNTLEIHFLSLKQDQMWMCEKTGKKRRMPDSLTSTDWNKMKRLREFQLLGFRIGWCTVTEFNVHIYLSVFVTCLNYSINRALSSSNQHIYALRHMVENEMFCECAQPTIHTFMHTNALCIWMCAYVRAWVWVCVHIAPQRNTPNQNWRKMPLILIVWK